MIAHFLTNLPTKYTFSQPANQAIAAPGGALAQNPEPGHPLIPFSLRGTVFAIPLTQAAVGPFAA